MQRRSKLKYMILASVVVLGLTLLMVNVDAQARIAFVSNRDGNAEIYVMNLNGGNLQNLTNNPNHDVGPAWYAPALAVEVAPFAIAPVSKALTMWGRLKQIDR